MPRRPRRAGPRLPRRARNLGCLPHLFLLAALLPYKCLAITDPGWQCLRTEPLADGRRSPVRPAGLSKASRASVHVAAPGQVTLRTPLRSLELVGLPWRGRRCGAGRGVRRRQLRRTVVVDSLRPPGRLWLPPKPAGPRPPASPSRVAGELSLALRRLEQAGVAWRGVAGGAESGRRRQRRSGAGIVMVDPLRPLGRPWLPPGGRAAAAGPAS
jgi:hypothetical protein